MATIMTTIMTTINTTSQFSIHLPQSVLQVKDAMFQLPFLPIDGRI